MPYMALEKTLYSLEDLAGFAKEFLAAYPKGAVVGLSGELGAGKTTFVRTVVRQLCAAAGVPEPRVTSPTFVIHQSYPLIGVDHFDLYRLENATEQSLIEIGYPEVLERCLAGKGYLFVEWPERVSDGAALGRHAQLDMNLRGSARVANLRTCGRTPQGN